VEQQAAAGFVLRGADGTLYLIRDEVLAACKIDGGDLEYARKFEAEGAGEDSLSKLGPFARFGRVDDTCATHPLEVCEARPEPAETLMCAW
jgi:hypothetical protein